MAASAIVPAQSHKRPILLRILRQIDLTGADMNKVAGIGMAVGLALTLPAAAEPANLLGAFGNWTAYSSGSGSSLTCFAMSEPRAKRPATVKRGKTYLMVTDWPSRKIKGEAQIVYGYQGSEKGAAALGVGDDKFAFFIRNNGKEASAWLRSLGENEKLIATLQDSVSAVASGVSSRGTKTIDTYSLSGFKDALEKIHAVCQM
jgi:hypothetical protein